MTNHTTPLEQIHDPLFTEKRVKVFVKRDDLIHPYVMGNKWRKLKYNLDHAKTIGNSGIVTMGGAYSNHIAATAAACREHGLESIGIIRGDELTWQSNSTLRFAATQGMMLEFVGRGTFRRLRNDPADIRRKYPNHFFLPEGGTNALALQGCAEVVSELQIPFDYLLTPLGTGGTMAGLLKGMAGEGKLIGFSVLKGEFIYKDFKQLIENNHIHHDNYHIVSTFHFGGYGKVEKQLIDMINRAKATINLLFDPIYTAKMYFGTIEMIRRDFFEPGSTLILLHTGGLQGIEGYNEAHHYKIKI